MSSKTEEEDYKLGDDLVDACVTGKLDKIKQLMPHWDKKSPPSVPSSQFLLQTAAKNGRADVMRTMLQSMPQIFQAPDHSLWSPKMKGVWGANSVKWETYEESIVISALEGSNPLAVFKLFFEHGMMPDYNLDRAGNTTSFAISTGRVDLVRFFLENGAEPYKWHPREQQNVIGGAAGKPTSDMLELLVKMGLKPESHQALRQAAEAGRLSNAQYLLDIGADINELYVKKSFSQDEQVGSPLHAAVRGSYVSERSGNASKSEMALFLLNRGAKPELLDGKGRTALQLAIELGDDDVAEVFRECPVQK